MNKFPDIYYDNYNIRLIEEYDATKCVIFYQENKHHLSPYETILPEHFQLDYWQHRIKQNKIDFEKDRSCCLGIFEKNDLIGMINFSNIIRGPFQSCFLGYKIAVTHQGKGIMKNSLKLGSVRNSV